MEIKTVLCPVDFSNVIERELQLAISICTRFKARLILQCNLGTAPPSSLGLNWMYAEEHLAQARSAETTTEEKLKGVFSRIPAGIPVEGKITHAPRDFAIVGLARECGSELIVMAQHPSSDSDQLSVAEQVLSESPCPVLTVQPAQETISILEALTAQSVLVPVDFTPHSMRTLDYAFNLARQLPITLHMLHLERTAGWRELSLMPFRRQNEREKLLVDCKERLLAMIPADLKQRVQVHLRGGGIVEGILHSIQELQAVLVVMGAHPKGFWKKAITGSTACQILRHSPCPVWFVPTTAGSSSWNEKPIAAGA